MKTLIELQNLAKEAEKTKNIPKAIYYYKQLYEITRKPAFLFQLGYLESLIPNHENSVSFYEKYVDYNPDDTIAYYNLAVEYFHLKNYPKSILNLKKAILKKPDFLQAYILLGYIYEVMENHQEAFRYFQRVLSIKPNYHLALQGIIFSLIKQKLYDQALGECEKYLNLYPNDRFIKNTRVQLLIQLKKTEEAFSEIKTLVETDERYKSFENYIHQVQERREHEFQEFLSETQKKLQEKLASLEEANEETNPERKTYLDISLLSLFSGKKEQAIEYLQKALEQEKIKKDK
ncbi:MAG: tetratricopeptide repeat protein [Leptospiraceae bacterium]|nr:tetratricopeptide repeat protein [Leptospiraceae bacterium]MDW7975261.1 tetratricopeptide repeat protein [Leptospiraceae bacterium]